MTSLVGYSLIWDSIDDRKNPTSGIYANFHQDVAGLGGQSKFVRETFDGKYYYPVDRRPHRPAPPAGRPDQPDRRRRSAADRQLQPRSDAGARLRAGRHGSARHHRSDQPRRQRARRHDLFRRLGGTPVPDLRPAEGSRAQGRDVRRRRHVVRLSGGRRTSRSCSVTRYCRDRAAPTGRVRLSQSCLTRRRRAHDPLVGRREPDLGVAARADPHRLRLRGHQGQVRPVAGVQLHRRRAVLIARREGSNRSAPGLLARFFMNRARIAPIRRDGESTRRGDPDGGGVRAGALARRRDERTDRQARKAETTGPWRRSAFFRSPPRRRSARSRNGPARSSAKAPIPTESSATSRRSTKPARTTSTFLDNPHYLDAFRSTRAGAAFVAPRYAAQAPQGCALLVTPQPYRAMAETMARLYPQAARPRSVFRRNRRFPGRLRPFGGAARAGRRRRSRRGDRPRGGDRRRHADRPQRRHRPRRAHRPRLRRRRPGDDRLRA